MKTTLITNPNRDRIAPILMNGRDDPLLLLLLYTDDSSSLLPNNRLFRHIRHRRRRRELIILNLLQRRLHLVLRHIMPWPRIHHRAATLALTQPTSKSLGMFSAVICSNSFFAKIREKEGRDTSNQYVATNNDYLFFFTYFTNISALSNVVVRLTADLKGHTLSPGATIFSLPNEMLAGIYHYLQDFSNPINCLTSEANAVPLQLSSTPHGPHVLFTQVGHHWRCVAFNASQLWSRITVIGSNKISQPNNRISH
ncbi:hypothetical protein M422DRAFT_255398 [Sphaerobolus stellatus SS14]|uniref:Unplaced genomic scaffold SPHSTscaffold_61, whole genome shotgun sequence n=1 Tax=Sphaerobolus stellatus (strain SS14) TaxID=990650 RepID=A0A0C9UES6_SPHS4|nr:hypothetical protein M422DRAFT_255398 [Sphaerobolus stellatus SS14]